MSLPCPPNTTAATALSTNPALVLALLRRVFSMYTTRSHGEQIQVLADVYAKDATATFEDPMMLVEGVDRIRVQFHALIKLFDAVEVYWNDTPSAPAITVRSTTAGTGTSGLASPDPMTPSSRTDRTFTLPRYSLHSPGALGPHSVDVVVPNLQVYHPQMTAGGLRERVMPRVVELPVQTVLTVVCEQVASGVGGASGTDVSSVSGGVSGMAGASPTVKREKVRTTVDPRTGAHVTERALFYQEEPKQSTFQQQVSPPTAAAQQPTFQQVLPQSTRLVVARHRDIWTEPAPLMRYGISAPGAKQLFGRVAAKAMQMWGW